MQQTVSEITSVENQINLFFHNHSLGKLLRQCCVRKEKGISLEVLFQFLLALAFTGTAAKLLIEAVVTSKQEIQSIVGKIFQPFKPGRGR